MDQELEIALKRRRKKYTLVTKMGLNFICNDDMMKNKKSR